MARQDITLNDIEIALKTRGERFTETRRRVMTVLLRVKTPQTAYALLEKLKDLKPMSVYRALDFLTAQGFAHRIESLNAYLACHENHCPHNDSQFMVCDSCGDSREIHDHDLDSRIAKNVTRNGFRINRKILEIHGICQNCR